MTGIRITGLGKPPPPKVYAVVHINYEDETLSSTAAMTLKDAMALRDEKNEAAGRKTALIVRHSEIIE